MGAQASPIKPPAGVQPGERWRSQLASDPFASRGRQFSEPESATRSPFQRDRDRVIHSSSFRRLKQKTQVFVAHEGDHYRTRLTHSLEVAQIARSLARVMGLDEDLAETLALAHDLGHPPFGHAGESELAKSMEPYDGFDHNAQALRIVTKLEARYAQFDGLNLTWETLEGVVKHNGPLLAAGDDGANLAFAFRDYEAWQGLELHAFASLEAQCAAIADDIAYNNHDVDDGIHAGLFTVDALMDVPLAGEAMREVLAASPGLEVSRLVHETVRRMIGEMVNDCLAETARRVAADKPETPDDVRACSRALVSFSDAFKAREKELRAFLWTNMYRHHRVNRMFSRTRRMVRDLFDAFMSEPGLLAPEHRAGEPGQAAHARAVCDHLAGMTDTYLIDEHRRLFATGFSDGR